MLTLLKPNTHFARYMKSLGASTLAACMFLTGCDVSESRGLGEKQAPDPVVADFPIAFIARSLPLNEDGSVVEQDILDPVRFNPGASLILKARASASAPEEVITSALFEDVPEDLDDPDSPLIPATYDIKDLEASAAGDKLIFALRPPADPEADEDEQPTWSIWEYTLETKALTPLLDSVTQEQGHDVSPHYLPDGRIVFTSTRQKRTKAILLDEGKPQYAGLTEDRDEEAFNLHVYDPINDELEQLSFNPSHDLQPTVLEDGRILFLRWDNINRHDQLSFYVVNPDGSQLERLYGYNAAGAIEVEGAEEDGNTPLALWHARTIGDGKVLINSRQRRSQNWGGDIVSVNIDQFLSNGTTNLRNPDTGEAEQSLSPISIDTTESPKPFSMGGLYNSAYPLSDGTDRLLTSWSACRLYDPAEDLFFPCTEQFLEREGAEPAAPAYGLWVLDRNAGTQLPIKPPTETEIYTEPVVIAPKPLSAFVAPAISDGLKAEDLGTVSIRNVYEVDGALPRELFPMPHEADRSLRPARFIRLVKHVPIPSRDVRNFDNSAFGTNRSQLMRDILGYVPIEPDGSAKFEVPANVPFMISLVDASGQRIGDRHENWISVQAGEQRQCISCHEHTDNINSGDGADAAHGRSDAELPSAYLGAPFAGVNDLGASTGQSMAESQPARTPSIDLRYRDIWTIDPAAREPDIALTYASIAPDDATALPPTSTETCSVPSEPVSWRRPSPCASISSATSWDARCRITINYEQHIQPLWERDRRNCDSAGDVVVNNTCTHCHSPTYANALGELLGPAASLNLTREFSNIPVQNSGPPFVNDASCNLTASDDYVESYVQLRRNRPTVVNIAGELFIPSTIRDRVSMEEDREVITQELVCNNRMSPINLADFIGLFESDPIHMGIMSPSELRLIAEWWDIGAQYYNNPFDAPLN